MIPATRKPSLKNKTGSWRTFRPVITEKCTGCGICVMHCPEGCIRLKDRVNQEKFKKIAFVNLEYCKGCLICMNECPLKAVDKKEES